MPSDQFQQVLDWCSTVVGPCKLVDTDERFHGRTSVCRLELPSGFCYLKVHRDQATWDAEVHGYETWGRAFGANAPRLLGIYEKQPFALLIAELPGRKMEDEPISESNLRQAWHDAGEALVRLHSLASGEQFGPCRRDGSVAGLPVIDAVEYVSKALAQDTEQAERAGYLKSTEIAVVKQAMNMVQAFEGEQPVPCHRDYNPANWLIDEQDQWIGVIDFEMSTWDARVAEFSRYPQWEWMLRPDLIEAFFDGYGRALSVKEQEQLFVAHVQYAVSCILWGKEHEYFGFVREAQQALETLGKGLE